MTTASKSRRGRWLGLAALVVGVILLAVLWPQGRSSPATTERVPASPPPPAPSRASPPPPAPPVQPPTNPAAEVAEPSPPPEAITPARPPEPPPPPLPPTTQPLAEEFYPGTTAWEEVPADNAHQYLLRLLPLRYNVVAPTPIAVLLELTNRQGQRQPLQNARVRVRALDDESKPWIEVPVTDDGQGADRQAGDLQYTATLQPDSAQRKMLLGRVLAEGSVFVPGTGTRVIPATLIYTVGPRARLTGRWSDRVRDGHLLLDAELQVEEAGLFTLMAQIFGPSLEPIAWVKQTERLGAGRGTITLEVFGKILHDSGIDGPYRVRQVLLTRDYENSSDYDPGVTIEEAHRTKAYRASELSAAAYVAPPRQLEEITADHPSQRDKPGPERTRDMKR